MANSINGLQASGMAPRARIATYKVCWTGRNGDSGCASSDSAAAIDAAIADGVDVINFSIGGPSTAFSSPDSVAFLIAADAGVWVATSNGNEEPGAQTVGTLSGVSWITAVGATQDNEVFTLNLQVSGGLDDSYYALEGQEDVVFSVDVARWALFNDCTDGNDDLDLYVYYCPGGLCSLVGLSGNFDANETVTVSSPPAGLYAIFVHGWETDGPDANYTLFSWTPGGDAGNAGVMAPASATLAATGTLDVNWSGLDSGEKYLGAVIHSDGVDTIGRTLISVSAV